MSMLAILNQNETIYAGFCALVEYLLTKLDHSFQVSVDTCFLAFPSDTKNRGYYMTAQKYKISLRVLKNISWVSAANK